MKRGRPARVPAAVLGVAALLLAAGAPGAASQGAPELDRVGVLAADGRLTRARDTLQEWWDARWEGADRSDRQQALWLRGKLTVDPDQASRDYRRLALEFPGGPYTASALLRLAQVADARGELLDAAGHYEKLLREYPDSPHRLEARRWLDAHAGAVTRAQRDAGPTPGDTGASPEVAPEGGAVETTEERPSGDDARDDEGVSPPTDDAPSSGDERGVAGPVAVQLGAFGDPGRARALASRARDEGVEVRLVRVDGSELIRVRAGRFPDRSAARDLRARLRGMGLQAIIVTDAREESPIQ